MSRSLWLRVTEPGVGEKKKKEREGKGRKGRLHVKCEVKVQWPVCLGNDEEKAGGEENRIIHFKINFQVGFAYLFIILGADLSRSTVYVLNTNA